MKRRSRLPDDSLALLRADAARGFEAAVQRASPFAAVRDCLNANGLPSPKGDGKTYVIAVGKAAPAMLKAALSHVTGARAAVCVTHRENAETVPGAEIFRAGHPVPDIVGASAATRVRELLSSANRDDVVIALISGGGSALLPAPVPGVSLEEKQELNQLLLKSGLDITSMNLVRQQVSELKGGGFLRLAAPAKVSAYILSDVVGDDLRAIASGPTVEPIGTAEDARTLLESSGVFERLPQSIRDHLQRPAIARSAIFADNYLVGGNRQSVESAAESLRSGYDVTIVESPLEGDVADAATTIFEALRKCSAGKRPKAVIWGGETTVTVRGTGIGGRNQELALRVAALADEQPLPDPWIFLSGGTDGRDGPTDAAGAIVDQGTLARIRSGGRDPFKLLENNDSHAALNASDDLLITGATGTNVADIQILLAGKTR